jgi:hypothetical protein
MGFSTETARPSRPRRSKMVFWARVQVPDLLDTWPYKPTRARPTRTYHSTTRCENGLRKRGNGAKLCKTGPTYHKNNRLKSQIPNPNAFRGAGDRKNTLVQWDLGFGRKHPESPKYPGNSEFPGYLISMLGNPVLTKRVPLVYTNLRTHLSIKGRGDAKNRGCI